MKINSTIFQPILPKQAKKEKQPEVTLTPIEQLKQSQHDMKELGQRYVEELEAARNDMGEDDPKAQQLIEKFKSGKKLTPDEMAYIRRNAPGMVEQIDRILREREVIELSMKAAGTKTEVQMVAFRAAKQIEKHHTGEEQEIRAKQLADAKHEYEQTDEYKEKPNSPLDREQRPARMKKYKKPEKQQVTLALQTYEQTKPKQKNVSLNELKI